QVPGCALRRERWLQRDPTPAAFVRTCLSAESVPDPLHAARRINQYGIEAARRSGSLPCEVVCGRGHEARPLRRGDRLGRGPEAAVASLAHFHENHHFLVVDDEIDLTEPACVIARAKRQPLRFEEA